MGGLQCATYLGDFGYKVLVLEKNNLPGGLTQSFKWKGCELSTGLHYIGGFDKGGTLNKIFNYLDLFDDIEYKKLDTDGFDVFEISGKKYKYATGFENYKKQLISYFPEEKKAIETYTQEVLNAVDSQELYHLAPITDTRKLEYYLQLNAWDYICSITENKELQQVLSAINFAYAGVKDKTPFYVHALITYHFVSGAYRIVGSTNQIINKLVSKIRNNSGDVLCKKEVAKIACKDKKATSIITTTGEVFFADNIISNIHPAVTVDLIENDHMPSRFRRRLKNKENTISSFALHLKLKPGTFKYINHNYSYYKNNDIWYASNYNSQTWPEHFFLHCHVPEDGSEYTDCITILTHMEYSEVEQWADLPLRKRGNEYNDFKEQKAEKMLAFLETKFPELKDNIIDYLAATPLTYKDYVKTPNGSMYGTLRDYKSPISSYISHKTKLDNLYFTGQNLNLHGVLGVSMSAIITCSEFVKMEDILNRINEKQ